MKIYMIIIMFILIGAFFVIGEHKIDLKKSDDRMKFGELYFSWFGQVFKNTGQIAGYIVKLDWLPKDK